MFKAFFFILCMLVSSCGYAQGFAAPRSTVYYLQIGPASGSSVAIAEGYLLTSAHVALAYPSVDIIATTRSGAQKVTIVKIDKEKDLALLAGNISCPCAPLANNIPPIDEPVVVIGYPQADRVEMQIATEGRVQGISPTSNLMMTTAQVSHGNSGGGMFVRRITGWELSAITDSVIYVPLSTTPLGNTYDIHHYLSLGVPIPTIREFLELPTGQPSSQKLNKLHQAQP